MSKPTPISGFPEWTPAQRMIEQFVLDRIRATFELYGFAPLETRSVEPLDQLLRKGETSKEVYLLRRLQADADGPAGDDALGLHFDLTVPFARYVLENAGKLQFPFRRYQIQKVWRGERPQEGRYREFLQADIDIVDRDTLPAHYEAEMPLVIGDALRSLPIPPVRIQVNNRKICEGFYRGIGLTDTEAALRAVDKLDKIGPAGVTELLASTAGASEAQAKAVLSLAEISAPDASFADAVRGLGVSDPLLDEGVAELAAVVETAAAHAPGLCVADLRIARGLDYYTGTVYETQMIGYERFGSICSGGRYDNLASSGNVRFPGVGISIGVTRLLGLLFGAEALSVSRSVPTCVLVAVTAEEDRAASDAVAAALRSRGVPTEVSPSAAKFGKQIRYAERRGIPYVWFPGADGDEVKDIRSGEQVAASAGEWTPPRADLKPLVGPAGTGV
ncbi:MULTISPECIES: histidine--tRNA ligase [Micromonospora]|uniref:histidine--tRNA ligase n=1 Tax=Micromonospora TaxID=1873 RepID=UPI000DE92EBB|nr:MULTISPECIES: histidine--tRNA ligase [Micromonospora]MBP1782573.1 histidyl-tRNA synthetase [Micromonospora sp. HB375]MCK1808804.1 histidine--tRNA ligase [Micromonospora sp. R42106]MCK1833350.1 histidine--tRNA ligase [Micromonospora sp. R42003]MCK1845209.1 histidine--tRNA ligase [Micromonospora sp. R42004]MCM1015624.1 histidine--tRNA ligase [Micromonospora sp. XM-20-01]